MGAYLSRLEERARDFRMEDTFAIAEGKGWEAETFSW
jgi:hypothetical protein